MQTEHQSQKAAPLERLRAYLTFATVGNPVLVKEFRTRMRGTRAYWLLLVYTALLAGIIALIYFTNDVNQQAENGGGIPSTEAIRVLGKVIYYWVFGVQAAMVALITPALTAGAVTIEREQRSYELLVTTPLKPVDIIRGKLTAAVSFVLLLLTASLPLVSISFLVGGVSPAEIAFSYLIIALAAFVYGSLGIFWSATLRTTAVATVVTYLTVLALFILTMLPGSASLAAGSGSGTGAFPGFPFQSLNPIFATFRAVQPEYLFAIQIPSWVSASVLNLLFGLTIAIAAMGRLEHFDPPPPVWLRVTTSLLWCSACTFMFGPLFGEAARSWTTTNALKDAAIGTTMMSIVMVSLVTPVLNTGDLLVRRGESAMGRYLAGWLPHRMFRADLSCGLPLTLAWAAFLLAIFPLAVAVLGKSKLFQPGQIFIPGVVLCLSVVLGLAGIGNLLSVTLPSRWASCVLTYLSGIVLMLLPYFTLIAWSSQTTHRKTPELQYQLLYLVPFDSVIQLGNPAQYATDHPAMLFARSVPAWLVTSALYLTIAAFCFLVTAARISVVGRQLQRRMESAEASEGAPLAVAA